MKKSRENNSRTLVSRKKTSDKFKMELKEVIVLVVVVSFITSALTGLVAGGLGADLFKGLRPIEETGEQALTTQKEEPVSTVFSQEEAVVKVVKQVAPAVVSIIVTKDLPVIEKYYQEYDPFGADDFFRQFFGDDFFEPFKFQIPQYRQKGTEKREVGGGTGFIVSSDGLILTNKHVVIDQEADYTVLTNEGEKIPAQVLARDPVQDIAILKIDRTGLPVVELGNSDNLQIGQTVIAIGNALGEFRNTVSVGVISGLKRSIFASSGFGETEELSEVIQTDAAINPGNSGGPLLNLQGKAIGINVAMAQGAQNIGFALPINKVKRDIEQVKREGKISYPFLGVRYVIITPIIQEKNNLPVDYGALIVRGEKREEVAVIPGGPADKAGLVENDIILEVDGQKVNQENTLAKLIQGRQVGEVIKLKILHKGKEKMVEVELGERE
jgi:S1-C subfamily serine protease